MGQQQQVENGHSGENSDEKTGNKITPKPEFRLFPPGYFANNDWAILLFGFAVLFAGVIIPSSPVAKFICAILLFLCVVALILHAFANRNKPTEEEIQHERDARQSQNDRQIHAQISEVKQRVGQYQHTTQIRLDAIDKWRAGRQLTEAHKVFISRQLQKAGICVKFVVRFSVSGRDAGQFANDITEALTKADWTPQETAFKGLMQFDFAFIIASNKSSEVETAMHTLHEMLVGCKAAEKTVKLQTVEEFPSDVLGIWIGTAP